MTPQKEMGKERLRVQVEAEPHVPRPTWPPEPGHRGQPGSCPEASRGSPTERRQTTGSKKYFILQLQKTWGWTLCQTTGDGQHGRPRKRQAGRMRRGQAGAGVATAPGLRRYLLLLSAEKLCSNCQREQSQGEAPGHGQPLVPLLGHSCRKGRGMYHSRQKICNLLMRQYMFAETEKGIARHCKHRDMETLPCPPGTGLTLQPHPPPSKLGCVQPWD